MAQYENMMRLIASEVCGAPLASLSEYSFTEETLKELYTVSAAHDLSHIVASALVNSSLIKSDSSTSERFKKQMMTALYRYEQTNFAYEEICGALEEDGIDFIPLKGSVIRAYYPEGWMRTSCDIDVLIRKEDIDRASEMLTQKLLYTDKHLGSHDVSFYTPGRVHIELHYELLEDDRANSCKDILAEAWSYAVKKEGYSHWYELRDDMFYFYHVAHMAKHLEIGGCGVRPFLDLWILVHKLEHDEDARRALLEKGRLLGFAEASERLAEVWFGGEAHDDITVRFEKFVISGGSYGTRKNQVAVLQTKKGSKLKYALSKIFLSYDVIKYQYPILFEHKWLLPYANVRRWCKLIFGGSAKRSIRELKMNNDFSREQANDMADLLKRIGLE